MLKLVILRAVERKASLEEEKVFDVELEKASKGYETSSHEPIRICL